MRLTSKGRYAVRAMLDLTLHSDGNPVRLQEISNRQKISLHYLEQLFRKLRNGKTVKSVRGPGGGYVLARSMDQITIKDILDCVGENTNPARDIIGQEGEGANTMEFALSREYFENLGMIMHEYLQTTSLGDLFRKAQERKSEFETTNNTTTNTEATSPFSNSVNNTSNFGSTPWGSTTTSTNDENINQSKEINNQSSGSFNPNVRTSIGEANQ